MTTPTITRRRAWARLLILMTTRELPDPQEISFHPNGSLLHVQVNSQEGLTEWRRALGFDYEDMPFEGSGSLILGSGGTWYGYDTRVYAYVPVGTREPVDDDEDMDAVRALADEDLAPGGEVAASAGVTGAATAPDAETLAVLDRHVGASPDRLVQPAPVQDPALRGDA